MEKHFFYFFQSVINCFLFKIYLKFCVENYICLNYYDMWYRNIFGVDESEYNIRSVKFNMANLIYRSENPIFRNLL